MTTRSLFISITAILALGTLLWLIVTPDLPFDTSVSPAIDSLAETDTVGGEYVAFVGAKPPDSMIVEGDRARLAEPAASMRLLESGDVAPVFQLETLDGGTFDLGDHLGDVVVLNFWASWCEPCHDEMPDLQMASEALSGQGVTFAGISMDEEGRAAVQAFHDAYPVDFPLLVDGLGVAREYGAHYVVPTTYVIDRDGLIADRFFGAVEVKEFLPRLREIAM